MRLFCTVGFAKKRIWFKFHVGTFVSNWEGSEQGITRRFTYVEVSFDCLKDI
jgi:hypothetical protein